MRWFICAVVLLALTPRAFADDLDVLRGTESVGAATFPRWSGFYFGGQVNYSDADTNFSGATQPLVAFSLRDLALEEVRFAIVLTKCSAAAALIATASAASSATTRNGRI